MGRNRSSHVLRGGVAIVLGLCCALLGSCVKHEASSTPAGGKRPTIASLVPAASDLLIGMGAGDHLVAVSNYDQEPQAANLPRVGDYQSIDWEKLAQIRPNAIITFYGPGKAPAGFLERTRELGIRDINMKLDLLSEVYNSIAVLGEAAGEPAKAADEIRRIRGQIEAVHQRVEREPKVRAAVVTNETGAALAGRNTFLDDLLAAAGGENAVTADRYVTLDREALAALRPQVVLLLLPGQDDAAAIARAKTFWESLPSFTNVKDHRVCPYTQTYIMQPGSHLGEVAALFAAALHPAAARPSTTEPSP